MNIKLSHERINSFCGDVLPLYLVSEQDLSKENIQWRSENEDLVILHTFSSDDPESVAHCALLTLVGVGETSVSATYNGHTYTCSVSVRPMRQAKKGESLNYFRGDFHDHTSNIHGHSEFAERKEGFVIDYLNFQKKDGKLDFAVVSDHAVTTNDRDFFAGFSGAEEIKPCPVEFLPGTESEITVIENDRFGITYKNAGEIVTVNSGSYVNAFSWQQFFDAMKRSPYAVCVLAHPQIVGLSAKGCWNFSLHKNNSPEFKNLLKGIETGDGGIRGSNAINEYVYSIALDNGFRVSTTCASDGHGPVWGYDFFSGKTVIMAYEKSKEAFLDALLARRFYATESGNVKVFYTVNGYEAASTLPLTDTYKFHIELSSFSDDPTTAPTAFRVISDYGRTVAEFKDVDLSDFDFEIKSDTARYFYIRFTDSEGRRTWSPPVWTSREADPPAPELTPLDKSGFTVTELESGKDASVLVNNDPLKIWESELGAATYLIDMKEEKTVSALGHYAPFINRKAFKEAENCAPVSAKIVAKIGREKNFKLVTALSRFVSKYEIWTSRDGENFEKCFDGQIRCFSGEDIIRFSPVKARYIKFKVLTNTGTEWRPSFDDLTLHIAELTVF
ncbi:MAG: hypothetical protein E7641_08060 [Ruminococcaceae bacterium]|nr:hypothetical protein [Oscillospiraceae bacterium]